MARGQSDRSAHADGPSPASLAAPALRLGFALTAMALPLAVGTGLAVVLSAPTLGTGLDTVITAASGPLGAPTGIGWLFHVGVLGVLAGTWLYGAGLLVSGLLD